jgi:hypothetical protein
MPGEPIPEVDDLQEVDNMLYADRTCDRVDGKVEE